MEFPGKGQEGEPGPGGTDRPVLSPKVPGHGAGPASGPLAQPGRRGRGRCTQERGSRSTSGLPRLIRVAAPRRGDPPARRVCPGSLRGRRGAQGAARAPRGLRVRARDLRPPPSLARSPLPRPFPPRGPGRSQPCGTWAGSPEGTRETIPESRPRARLPRSRSPGGRGVATEPLRPRVGAPGGALERGRGRRGWSRRDTQSWDRARPSCRG